MGTLLGWCSVRFSFASIVLFALFHYAISAKTYSVLAFGAKGDGKTLDTRPIQKAVDACLALNGNERCTVLLPGSHVYLSFPLNLSGLKNTEFRIDLGATLLASDDVDHWPLDSQSDKFLDFLVAEGASKLAFTGLGWLNGNGIVWWEMVRTNSSVIIKHGRPILLRCSGSELSIVDLHMQDSPYYHIVMDGTDITIANVNILAPPDSPNTDGVVLYGERVLVTGGKFAVGGGDNVRVLSNHTSVERMQFGTGHGTCIGSVKNNWIENVTFADCDFIGTQQGARIKAWPGAKGLIRRITWRNCAFHFVLGKLINIDMFYRDNLTRPTTLKIDEVFFEHVTSKGRAKAQQAGVFRCQPSAPCSGINLKDVDFGSANPNIASFVCEHATLIADNVLPALPSTCTSAKL